MTATQSRPTSPNRTELKICYQVAMPQPESHLFEVTLQLSGWQADWLDLKLPVWTPGSYLIREYARHLQEFAAVAEQPLPWHKLSKNHWQIDTNHVTELTIRYRVFANELTVRTNHLDATHGYFNGAALFFYIPGLEHQPIQVTVVPPHSDWQVFTPLPPDEAQPYTFTAPDFDTLVDSPFEVGKPQVFDFEVLGKPHQFVVWGQGNFEADAVLRDTSNIIAAEANLFGGLPYERYLFLLHLSSQGFGGLEHKNACTLNYSRFGFRDPDKYYRFMQLVAHEFFHLWNVKRIRPQALEVFDYDAENYTPSLWFSEGTTSYYDLIFPLRAEVYDAKTFLKGLSQEISRFLTIPGRQVQPLSESSFDAWIKLYRRDANSDNSQISYYLKGEMVSLLLDLLIREQHQNARSLDDVMRQMWEQFGREEVGFTPEQLQQVIAAVAGTSLDEFFHLALHTTAELPLAQSLEPFGLQLQADSEANPVPFTGMKAKAENGKELIKFVETGSPAQQAGIDAGDELLALNGLRVTAEQLSDRLKDFRPGEAIEFTVFHQDELRVCTVILADPRPSRYQLVSVAQPTERQQQNFAGWLGVPLATLTAD